MSFSPVWLHMEYFYLRDDYQLFIDIAKSNDTVVSELQAMYEQDPPAMVSWVCPSDSSSVAFEHGGLHSFHCLILYDAICKTSLCSCHLGCYAEGLLSASTLEVGGISSGVGSTSFSSHIHMEMFGFLLRPLEISLL